MNKSYTRRLMLMSTNPLSLHGMKMLLSSVPTLIQVTSMVTDSVTLRQMLQKNHCDLVLCEAGVSGIALRETIKLWVWAKNTYPDVSWAMFLTPQALTEWLYITRQLPNILLAPEESETACQTHLYRGLEGDIVRSPCLQKILNSTVLAPVERIYRHGLTSMQWATLCDLALGLSVSEIARYRHRSIKTISTHKMTALKRLGIGNDVELHRWLNHQRNVSTINNISKKDDYPEA